MGLLCSDWCWKLVDGYNMVFILTAHSNLSHGVLTKNVFNNHF